MSSPTSDTTVERILTELYHSYNGAKGEAVAVTNAATALNAHYAQKMEVARLDQIHRDFLHVNVNTDIDEAVLLDLQKSQEEEVRAKAKEEGIELDGTDV